jgi:hypothetical protein
MKAEGLQRYEALPIYAYNACVICIDVCVYATFCLCFALRYSTYSFVRAIAPFEIKCPKKAVQSDVCVDCLNS